MAILFPEFHWWFNEIKLFSFTETFISWIIESRNQTIILKAKIVVFFFIQKAKFIKCLKRRKIKSIDYACYCDYKIFLILFCQHSPYIWHNIFKKCIFSLITRFMNVTYPMNSSKFLKIGNYFFFCFNINFSTFGITKSWCVNKS